MTWFRKDKAPKTRKAEQRRSGVPEGLWVKCEDCKEIIYSKELARRHRICPKCSHHFRLSAAERLELLFDEGRFQEFAGEVRSTDPLKFKDGKGRYRDRLLQYEEAVGTQDAIVCARGTLGGIPVVMAVMEFAFMGGSMGSVVGEKLTRAIELCLQEEVPLIAVSCSGGARMQEGALSLMQMAKISAALARLDEAGLPFISVLTNPTSGGVTASFAMLGDLNIAEPHAFIGFAGPRVIEQTIRQTLPEGFQRSEFVLEHGMLDLIVERGDLKATLVRCLKLLV